MEFMCTDAGDEVIKKNIRWDTKKEGLLDDAVSWWNAQKVFC